MKLLERRGLPQVWRRSVAEALAVIDMLDARIAALEAELRPPAHADPRVQLLVTIPGVGDHLGLMIAAEIGEIGRFPCPRNLIGFAGLAPRVAQSGQSSRTGALSKAGSRSLRWAAIEAAQCAWRPTNPWNRLYRDVKKRTGKSNPAKSAVARKVLIAAWNVLARKEPFKPSRAERRTNPVPASSHFDLAA
jgi:transposase